MKAGGQNADRGAGPASKAGAFVYRGSGKKQSDDAPIEQRMCKDKACAIQRCLTQNNHQQKRCEVAISEWKLCCETAKAAERARLKTGAIPIWRTRATTI